MRLSVTLLDQYRYFRANEWADYDKLIESVQGKFEPTPAMRAGTALHHVFETRQFSAHCDGEPFWFDPESVDRAFGKYWEWPAIHEARAEVEIDTELGPVTLSGQADALIGNTALELKSSDKTPNLDRHMDSLQWRAYCLAFEIRRVDYILAQIKEKDGVWSVVDCQELPLYPYPDLKSDLERWTNDFVVFLRDRDMLNYLNRESRIAA